MKTNFITALLLSFVSMFATAGEWTAGYLQGTNTYYLPLDSDNANTAGYIELDCVNDPEMIPSLYASIDGRTTLAEFTLYVDSGTESSMSYEFTDNQLNKRYDFKDFYNAIRVAKTIEVTATINGVGQERSTKPKQSGEAAIPAIDSVKFACVGAPAQAPASLEPETAPAAAVVDPIATTAATTGPVPTPQDFEVDIRNNGSRNILTVTSKLDNINITGLTFNRGNCTLAIPRSAAEAKSLPKGFPDPANYSAKFPTPLKFAQRAEYWLEVSNSCSDILEFYVHTDRGSVGYHKE